MYFITSIICAIDTGGIQVKSEQALKDTVNVIKWIFTPVNALIALSTIGNTLGKAKDQVITADTAGKRLIIIGVVLIILFIFETNYIKNFITGVLGNG